MTKREMETTRISFDIPLDLKKWLDDKRVETGASQTFILVKAVREYIENHEGD